MDKKRLLELAGVAPKETLTESVRYRSAEDMSKSMFKDIVKLKRNTAAVIAEVRNSKQRKDYTEMVFNELEETYNEIDRLVEKYEDAEVR